MKVAVWDTYVKRADTKIMHFDILVPETETDHNKIYQIGEAYLKTKTFETKGLSTKQCNFCHLEEPEEVILTSISNDGFYIMELENCN